MQHKAIIQASHIQLSKRTPSIKVFVWQSDRLKPLDVKKCLRILSQYRDYLGKGTIFALHEKNPNKMARRWESKNLERSKEISRKMLKQAPKNYKKAA